METISLKSFLQLFQRQLLPYTSNPLFPWFIALLSCINTFMLFLSGPLSILFITTSLIQGKSRQKRYYVAFANAVGATAGIALLVFGFHVGSSSVDTQEVNVEDDQDNVERFAEWKKMQVFLEEYMLVGIVMYSTLPIILHPMVFFVLHNGIADKITLLMCILIGRTIKYCVMAELAYLTYSGGKQYAKYLRLFGIKSVEEIMNIKGDETSETLDKNMDKKKK